MVALSASVPTPRPGSRAEQLEHWTPNLARANCLSVANQAIRRANVSRLVYTRPARYREGAWTLTGVVFLTGAPMGLKTAPFICTFTVGSDIFETKPGNLTMGP